MKPLIINDFIIHIVGTTGFEPATSRPPDVYANRTALRPVGYLGSKYKRNQLLHLSCTKFWIHT